MDLNFVKASTPIIWEVPTILGQLFLPTLGLRIQNRNFRFLHLFRPINVLYFIEVTLFQFLINVPS